MCVSAISFNFSLPLLWRRPAFYFPPSNAFNSQIPRFFMGKAHSLYKQFSSSFAISFPLSFHKGKPFFKKGVLYSQTLARVWEKTS